MNAKIHCDGEALVPQHSSLKEIMPDASRYTS